MGIKKEINGISTTHARSIVLRFMPKELANSKDQSERHIRTLARGYCRKIGKSPKQVVSMPLPK